MKMPLSCSVPPPRMSVTVGQVHVWHAPLDISRPERASLEETLAPDELARAAQFRHPTDRQRFVTCRGRLREILSRYTGEPPAALEFGYGPCGKPRLKSAPDEHQLGFNVSHSQGLAVFAIALDREVGIDIERFQTDFLWEEIAATFFSVPEVNVLYSLPVQDRYEAFLIAWTCKEACAKARGDGLSRPLEQLEASLTPDQPWSFKPAGNPQESSRWTLKTFTPLTGYAAALAAEGTGWQVTSRPWRV
jgi:4'-phosphopantetheinyl transferase